MDGPFPNRMEGGTLRRWVVRAFVVGLAAGAAVAIAALLR